MLASITPLGERGRNRRWGHTVAFYVVGSVLGGATRGLVLGGIGSLVPSALRPAPATVAIVLAGLLVVAAGIESGLVPVPVPGVARQVNEDWLDRYRGWVIGFGFGYQLGLAFVVYITTASLWVVFAAEFLSFSPLVGMAIGGWFGLVRTFPLLTTARIRTTRQLRDAHAAMNRRARPAERVVAATCSLAAAVLVLGVIV